MSPATGALVADRPRHRSPRIRLLAVPVLALALVAVGCGKKDPLTGSVVKEGLTCTPSVARRKDAPKVGVTKVGKKVVTKDLIVGKGGCVASTSDYLSLDIVGATAADGKVFTSSFKSGHPLTTQLGQGQLVTGLETGLQGLKVGGRREIQVPAAAGYGKDGNKDQGIGPNAALVFYVDLIATTTTPKYCAQARDIPTEVDGKKIEGKPTDIRMPVDVPFGKVETRDLVVGKGPVVGNHPYVTVRYYGVSCLTGLQFDSSWDRGAQGQDSTFAVTLGTNTNVIVGWTRGLETARVGSIRQLDIPAPLAYGSAGQSPAIAPNDSLVFIIQVVSASDKAPPTTTTTTPGATATTAPAATTTTVASTTTAKATTTTKG